MTEPALIAPTRLAEMVASELAAGDQPMADRLIPEAISRILQASESEAARLAFDSRPTTTGDPHYDALIAATCAWALRQRHVEPPRWMTDFPPLPTEWMWGASPSSTSWFREWIRKQTPPEFLEKGLLLRESDLGVA